MKAPADICFTNTRLGSVDRTTVRLAGAHIASVGAPPRRGDVIVDAGADRMLPGLINAHDHLQLNNFPRLKFRALHENVGEWISDIDARRASDPDIVGNSAVARDVRLRLGGIKNLLSGVTTVAHHDPVYPALQDADFPCRVLSDFGWSHSLALDGDEKVRASYRATPPDQPWFIHAGEGIDATARAEFARLEKLGCIGANTLLIHGVAFTADEYERLAACRAGLIWCPASNHFLFGRTADCTRLIARGRVALGSDSRLTGAVDLLSELGAAQDCWALSSHELESLVTTCAADLLRLDDRGTVRAGALADCILLPRGLPLGAARRADLRCVIQGGVMRYGDADYAERLMKADAGAPVLVDGRPKILERPLADFLRTLSEPGVQVPNAAGKAA